MRILCCYRGTQQLREVTEPDFLIGRAHENSLPLLDLSPDAKVSRLHARIWQEDGCHWIEDRQSSRGTLLNGIEIKAQGKKRINAGDEIVVGETSLRLQSLDSPDSLAQTNYLEIGTSLLPGARTADAAMNIT